MRHLYLLVKNCIIFKSNLIRLLCCQVSMDLSKIRTLNFNECIRSWDLANILIACTCAKLWMRPIQNAHINILKNNLRSLLRQWRKIMQPPTRHIVHDDWWQVKTSLWSYLQFRLLRRRVFQLIHDYIGRMSRTA